MVAREAAGNTRRGGRRAVTVRARRGRGRLDSDRRWLDCVLCPSLTIECACARSYRAASARGRMYTRRWCLRGPKQGAPRDRPQLHVSTNSTVLMQPQHSPTPRAVGHYALAAAHPLRIPELPRGNVGRACPLAALFGGTRGRRLTASPRPSQCPPSSPTGGVPGLWLGLRTTLSRASVASQSWRSLAVDSRSSLPTLRRVWTVH